MNTQALNQIAVPAANLGTPHMTALETCPAREIDKLSLRIEWDNYGYSNGPAFEGTLSECKAALWEAMEKLEGSAECGGPFFGYGANPRDWDDSRVDEVTEWRMFLGGGCDASDGWIQAWVTHANGKPLGDLYEDVYDALKNNLR